MSRANIKRLWSPIQQINSNALEHGQQELKERDVSISKAICPSLEKGEKMILRSRVDKANAHENREGEDLWMRISNLLCIDSVFSARWKEKSINISQEATMAYEDKQGIKFKWSLMLENNKPK